MEETRSEQTHSPSINGSSQGIKKRQTPRNVQENEAGGFRLRLAAYFFDGIILSLPLGVVFTILNLFLGGSSSFSDSGINLFLYIFIILIGISYYIYFDVKNGVTPGKNIYGLKVVNKETNQTLSKKNATIRELVARGIVSIPILGFVFLIINGLVLLLSEEKMAIHDKLVKSQVYKVKRSWSILKQIGLFAVLLFVSIALQAIIFVGWNL